jgi:hypothetical protein
VKDKNQFLGIAISILAVFIVCSCIVPVESDDSLVGDIPIVVNTNDSFTYTLLADNYSAKHNYQLSLTGKTESFELVNTVVVNDFKPNHSEKTSIQIFNGKDSLLYNYDITSNMVTVDTDTISKSNRPNRVVIDVNSFSGLLELVIAVSD